MTVDRSHRKPEDESTFENSASMEATPLTSSIRVWIAIAQSDTPVDAYQKIDAYQKLDATYPAAVW
jgi:hypothetical protein